MKIDDKQTAIVVVVGQRGCGKMSVLVCLSRFLMEKGGHVLQSLFYIKNHYWLIDYIRPSLFIRIKTHFRSLLVFTLFFLFSLSAFAQPPVFQHSNCRSVLDSLTCQFNEEKMDPGDMGENDEVVLAYIKEMLDSRSSEMDGFNVYVNTIRTKPVHLHWEADEYNETPCDMNVKGRWICEFEWPSSEIDSGQVIRRWINMTLQEHISSTFYGNCSISSFSGDLDATGPMMDYYAAKYRRFYREQTLANRKEDERDGAFRCLYEVEFNPVIFIRIRCINAQYVTFYVADFRPSYRSTPSYYQQTVDRISGKSIMLEDIGLSHKIPAIIASIRKTDCGIWERDVTLEEVLENHQYCLALTESGVILSFLPYTFSITAGSDAVQVRLPYSQVFMNEKY